MDTWRNAFQCAVAVAVMAAHIVFVSKDVRRLARNGDTRHFDFLTVETLC